jgi:hypothetical protein
MKMDVENFIKQCNICQQAKHSHTHPMGLLNPLPIPKDIWRDLSMDFIEGLPKSKGFSAILVVVDRLTKYAHLIPVKHPYTAATIAQLFLDNIIKLHGLPNFVVFDRDNIFVSNFWKALFTAYNIDLNLTTASHPQSDGQTERVNQCLEMYLRCSLQDAPTTWKDWLPLAELWYNSSHHSSIGCSPFKALYGCEADLGVVPVITDDTPEDVRLVITNKELHLVALKHHMTRAQNRMKQYADRKRTDHTFAVGDMVLLKLQPHTQSSVANRPYPKLSFKYFGPYQVLEKVGSVAYKLQLPPGAQIHNVFHISQLKPFTANYAPVFDKLPVTTDLQAATALPKEIVECRLVKKGNAAILQVRVTWTGLPDNITTWEDYTVVKSHFLDAPAWGHAAS